MATPMMAETDLLRENQSLRAQLALKEKELERVRKRLAAFQAINVGQAIDKWRTHDGSKPLMEALADDNMDIQTAQLP